ncbi:MAG: hypothetical protein WDZ84_14195 [Rhodovibrionaceae bacterium]
MPSPLPRKHGYGGHRQESFAAYYRRSVLSEGCSCSERVLDPSNRPDQGGALLVVLLSAPLAFWRWLRKHF